MSSHEREESRERDMVVRHQPSFSDSGRGPVPMWDSSDPDRAPPPLPLNPGSGSPVANKNASKNVTAAAEAIAARARENMFIAQSIKARSNEKSLMKGQFHKRLTSIQPGAVKDLSAYLESNRSPEKSKALEPASSPEKSPEKSPAKKSTSSSEQALEKSPEKPTESALERFQRTSIDLGRRSPERSLPLPSSPTPTPRTPLELSRPSSRREFKPILGETPPQSATMKALQATPASEPDRIARMGSESSALVRAPQNLEAISNQILGLTSIATRLQQEMAALSRRSKDNATDLISLKEATNTRDEDIRKSLRDLISNVSQNVAQQGLKDTLGKANDSPSKSLSFPRLSTASDRAIPFSSGLESGAEAVALLEKVLKEMATKEGQDELMASITRGSNMSSAPSGDSRLTKQLEEVIGLLKDHALNNQHNSRALVRSSLPPPPHMEHRGSHYGSAPNSPHGGPLAKTRNITPRGPPPHMGADARPFPGPTRPGDFVNDEIFKLLKRMKDSIAEGGGMSAEIKALVRELRGEVLGMGREIGRKLDQSGGQVKARDQSGEDPGLDHQVVHRIVQEGLEGLKIHFDQASREIRRQSSSSVVSRSAVDPREIHAAVRSAMRDVPLNDGPSAGLQREEILNAVREAWETYKPEIEMQNFGLERDEILQCLKDGLEEHRAKNPRAGSATYEEVLDAVRDGLKDFKTPPVESDSAVTREEIVMTMRECLQEFEMTSSGPNQRRQFESLREDVLDAVRDGMARPVSKEVSFDLQDLFEAVQTSLQNNPITGELFDTIKDRMEGLRASIETYVDRAADVTGKDEIIDTVRSGLNTLRGDLEASIASIPRGGPQGNNADLLDAMEKEFEHLRSTISLSTRGSEGSIGGREELLDAIRDGFDELRGATRAKGEPVSDSGSVMDELKHLRTTLAANLTRGGGAIDREEILDTIRDGIDKAQLGLSKSKNRPESVLSSSSELLEVFNESLDTLKGDIERIVNKPIDMTVNYEILDTLKEGLRNLRTDFEGTQAQRPRADTGSTKRGGEVIIADEETARAHSSGLNKLEVMMTQLKMKVESLDTTPSQPAESGSRPDLERLEVSLKDTQKTLSDFIAQGKTQQDTYVSKEDTDAIETLLRNTKAIIEETNPIEHLESIEGLMREAKDAIDEMTSKQDSQTATKSDLAHLEVIVKDLQSNVHEIREQGSEAAIGREEHEALAETCAETRNILKAIAPDSDGVASKTDLNNLQDLIEEFQETVNANARLQAQAFDARKIEHGGLADKMEETRTYVESMRSDLDSALHSQQHGIESLNVALAAIEEAVTGGAVVATLKALRDNIEAEFTKSQATQDASRSDMEIAHKALFEKHDEHKAGVVTDITAKIEERFDELMTKYDDAERSAVRKEEALHSKASEQAEAMESTRAAAEDLKILIDTLGTTVTDTCERMTEDSKTVYNRVDEIGHKVEETAQILGPENRTEHQLTRVEMAKSLVAIETLKSDVSEWNPKMMSAVSDILRMMNEQYDEVRKSSEEIKVSVEAIPGSINIPALPAPQDSAELDRSMSSAVAFDESAIHSKLDRLVESVAAATDNSAQLGTMREIQEQLSSAVFQLQSFADTTAASTSKTDRSRESGEVAIAIEKRYAQKDAVEAEIVRLSDERTMLEAAVEALKQDQKELATHKAKLQADVQSLETALRLRREEMDLMESRAENLERRVLEGVLDHSRSLLLSSRPSSLRSMDLKRVASNASSTATLTTTGKGSRVGKAPASFPDNALSSAVGAALKKRQPAKPAGSSGSSSKGGRRILSLSAAGGNRSTPVERSLVLANPSIASKASAPLFGGMKRSHSVKSDLPSRKSSWTGPKHIALYNDELGDKENSLLEEDEEDGSDLTTDRRTSYTGTYTGTEDSYDTESMAGRRSRAYTASNVGSLTPEDEQHEVVAIPKNSSTEAVVDGLAPNVEGGVLVEQGTEEFMKEIVLYGDLADSGLGTDPPTAGLESVSSMLFTQE